MKNTSPIRLIAAITIATILVSTSAVRAQLNQDLMFGITSASGGNNTDLVVDLGNPANLYYGESWALGTLLASSGNTDPANVQWGLVGATYDGTTGTIWINGSAEGTFTGASAIGTSSQHMMIGEWPGAPTGTYWYGYQANVCIFNQSIDATQMARMNTAGPGTCLPGAP